MSRVRKCMCWLLSTQPGRRGATSVRRILFIFSQRCACLAFGTFWTKSSSHSIQFNSESLFVANLGNVENLQTGYRLPAVLLLISCTVDNQFKSQPTKCTKFFLKCLCHTTTQKVATCFRPQRNHHQGTWIKKQEKYSSFRWLTFE
jgi:hypothetical protein